MIPSQLASEEDWRARPEAQGGGNLASINLVGTVAATYLEIWAEVMKESEPESTEISTKA